MFFQIGTYLEIASSVTQLLTYGAFNMSTQTTVFRSTIAAALLIATSTASAFEVSTTSVEQRLAGAVEQQLSTVADHIQFRVSQALHNGYGFLVQQLDVSSSDEVVEPQSTDDE